MFIDNDEPLYRQKKLVFHALARKKDRGQYRDALAPKAFLPLVNTGAKKYIREFGAPGDKWNVIFSPIDRRQATLGLMEQFLAWYDVDYPAMKAKGRS